MCAYVGGGGWECLCKVHGQQSHDALRKEGNQAQHDSVDGAGSNLESDTGWLFLAYVSTVQFGKKFLGVIQSHVHKEAWLS